MFKTETHLHTSEISPCGKISAKEMVKRYHEAGYKTPRDILLGVYRPDEDRLTLYPNE